MIPFELAEPKTLREAVALLDTDDPGVRPIAGGTALMLMMKAGVFQPSRLISLGKIEKQFSTIYMSVSGELRIGAMTPLSALESSPDVRAAFPVIAETLRTLANVRVRNVARVGGAGRTFRQRRVAVRPHRSECAAMDAANALTQLTCSPLRARNVTTFIVVTW